MDAWFDAHKPGPVTVAGRPFAQTDGTTCGTTAIMLARVLADPQYAQELADGGPDAFTQRLVAEQRRLHRWTNRLWPQALGTTPWGVRRGLAEQAGHRYRIRWTRSADKIVAAVDAGYPVPLLVGNCYPAHYLLVVAHEADQLLVYNPAGGRLVPLTVDDLRTGRLSGVTAYRRTFAVLLPTLSRSAGPRP
ncbi:hypothetical protein [Cryptosporangium aurantiacum]|uniref:Peptidase_C39 like family protein n=1 Tax=Cryptosporangium aurantiacum TaxID=134849 RepID=A0A1M7PUI5_9ACTN|nr:hypothetical protein [Cryptosporangium aurantiacum]SHN21070.1 hypothetical protein SAMN05443668_103700 [Cryptosporangium aurantiacum]